MVRIRNTGNEYDMKPYLSRWGFLDESAVVGGNVSVVGVLNVKTVSTKHRYGTNLSRWEFLDESAVVGGDVSVVGVLNRNTVSTKHRNGTNLSWWGFLDESRNTVSTKHRYGTNLFRWGFLDESAVVGGDIPVVGVLNRNTVSTVQSIDMAPTFPGGDFLMKAPK
jgi:hypothetical protein